MLQESNETEGKELPFYELYTAAEVAKILGVSQRTIQNYIASGRLKGQKIAGKWKFTREELDRFVRGV